MGRRERSCLLVVWDLLYVDRYVEVLYKLGYYI